MKLRAVAFEARVSAAASIRCERSGPAPGSALLPVGLHGALPREPERCAAGKRTPPLAAFVEAPQERAEITAPQCYPPVWG